MLNKIVKYLKSKGIASHFKGEVLVAKNVTFELIPNTDTFSDAEFNLKITVGDNYPTQFTLGTGQWLWDLDSEVHLDQIGLHTHLVKKEQPKPRQKVYCPEGVEHDYKHTPNANGWSCYHLYECKNCDHNYSIDSSG